MLKPLTLVGTLLLAGCAASAQSPYPHRSGAESFVCRNTGLERFVGRQATQQLGREMLTSTGAKVLRWVSPGQMVTMEFRSDRLTIHIDGQGRVQRAACG